MNTTHAIKGKEKKMNFIYSYKDQFEIKYKKLHDIQTPTVKNKISKIFKKSFHIKEKNKTPLLKLNKSNSVLNYNRRNIINLFDNNKLNNSNEFNNNILHNISKEKEYYKNINRNKKRDIIQSPSFSCLPNALREKILFKNNINKRYNRQLKNISNNKDTFNLNKSSSTKNYLNIRQKFLFQRNNSQKNIFNDKSFQNFFKTSKNMNIYNNNNLINSISIKELNPNISEKDKDNNTRYVRMHGIDLKLKELLEKYNKSEEEKNNEKKEKDKKLKKLISIAQFYDNLPSLIQKKNEDKYWMKPCKKPQLNDFGQSYFSTVKIMKEEEKRKKKLDKIIHKYPIIRYLFLQKILNSLVHKIKLFGKKEDDLLISSNTLSKLNEEIKDFITYGYEFIPENILLNKIKESPKDLLIDDEFIQVILNTKTSIDNTLNNESKDISNLKLELGFITNSGVRLDSKNLEKNASYKNIMEKFLEIQRNKDSLPKKSRFLYKKININKIVNNTNNNSNNKMINKNTISIDMSKIKSNKINNNNIEKSENVNININKKKKKNNYINNNNKSNINKNKSMLNQIFKILYENIDNLVDIIKKNKKKSEKNKKIKYTEIFWRKLLKIKDNNSQILIIQKRRRIKSSEIYKNKNRNKLYYKYQFESIEKRRIKSGKKYIEIELTNNNNNTEYEVEDFSKNYLKPKKPYNVYYRNYENQINHKKKPKINILKKTEMKSKKLENIPETSDVYDSIKENKKKENSITYKNDIKIQRRKISRIKTKKKPKRKKVKNDSENSESSESSKSENENDDSLYTSIDLEDVIQEENKEKKKHVKKIKIEDNSVKENKNSFKDYLSEYKEHINQKKDNQIISNLIDTENQKKNQVKKKKKMKILSSTKKEKKYGDYKYDDNKYDEIKYNNKYDKIDEMNIIANSNQNIFFNDIKGKSFEDIEKRRLELLYKMKHDIQYKVSIGNMNSIELENFEIFQNKINDLKERYEEYDINTYIKNMELYFQSFQEEMEKNEKKKLEEDRINKYLRQFYEEYDFKNFYKDIQKNILCKVINFSQINHINTLNDNNNDKSN